jgi:formyltetrahydrofolate deformylase
VALEGETGQPGAAPAEGDPPQQERRYSARLLIACPDQPGIVSKVSGFLFGEGANIVSSHQYSTDPSDGRFYLRTEFFLDDLPQAASQLEARFAAQVADPLEMDWSIRYWGERQRLGILVSRHDHCLVDLLWRWRRGELDVEIVCVISNHRDLEGEVRAAGVAFHHVAVERERKREAERQMLDLLHDNVDVLVLARYMQILSGEMLSELSVPVINIHHSFLPAFAGANPYRRARERGVKLIGATAHYVTAELDGGPIIDQDVARVDHSQSQADLERVGRDVERMVLARALALHLDDRVIVDGARTIVL